jgi:PncC family amidohydrolase
MTPTRPAERGEAVVDTGADTQGDALAAEAGRLAAACGWSLAVAESCTGGLIGHRLTSVAGSSAYFRGGIIAYANDVKTGLLGVSAEDLAAHGAVSEQVARQMASGVRNALRADVGIASTGIMGPGGATLAKPVGLVYIAVATPERTLVRCFRMQGDRTGRTRSSSEAALGLLIEALQARTRGGVGYGGEATGKTDRETTR